MEEIKEKAYNIIDNLLNKLSKSRTNVDFNIYASKEKAFAKEIMIKYQLVTFNEPSKLISFVYINPNSLKVLEAGGTKKYLESIDQKLEEKGNLELQKLRMENEKLVNELIDYDKIKLQRNWSFAIACISCSVILIKFLLGQ